MKSAWYGLEIAQYSVNNSLCEKIHFVNMCRIQSSTLQDIQSIIRKTERCKRVQTLTYLFHLMLIANTCSWNNDNVCVAYKNSYTYVYLKTIIIL